MLNLLIVAIIGAFWGIVSTFMTALGVVQFVVQANNFVSSVSTYLPQFMTYLSYVYYFIDRSRLLPLISLTFVLGMVRLGLSLLRLIKW